MKTLDEVITVLDGCFLKSRKEWCVENCPYLQNDEKTCRRDVLNDALHYLKEYKVILPLVPSLITTALEVKKMRDMTCGTSQKLRNTSQITCPKCHSEFVILDDPDGDHQQLEKCRALMQDFYRNDPITWDELRQMTGKPVWLESHGDIEEFTGWVIVSSVLSDRAHFIFSHYDGNFLTYEMSLPDCTFGTKWQAYRKER